MKYYGTYAEAKAAYPDCDAVVTTGPKWYRQEEFVGKFAPVCKADASTSNEWTFCDRKNLAFPKIASDAWIIATPPKTRTEYVKVTESIFDLKEEFERGELYYLPNDPDNYKVIDSMHILCNCAAYATPKIYRRIEKEVDWRDETANYLSGKALLMSGADYLIWENGDAFLEMCRIALRATGELD